MELCGPHVAISPAMLLSSNHVALAAKVENWDLAEYFTKHGAGCEAVVEAGEGTLICCGALRTPRCHLPCHATVL